MLESKIKPLVESILFSCDRPILAQQIQQVDESLTLDQICRAIEELRQEYIKEDRGIRIIEVAGGFQIVTAEEFFPFLKKFFREKRKERLSTPALETLAIIAYKQPITKLQIEALRRVKVDGIVEHLKELGLVKIVGRRNAPGRPYLYGTSKQFLEFFGLKSLKDLPQIENFKPKFSFGNSHGRKEKDETGETSRQN